MSALVKPLEKKTKLYMVLSVCLILLFLWQLVHVSTVKPIGITTSTGASKAVDFLKKNQLKGPIFNNFDIGSYLIFRLFPNEKVFVDGRPEAYPASFFQKTYIPMQQDKTIFTKIDKKYSFNTIFFSHTDQTSWAKQFLQQIVKNPQWHVVYLDDTVIILTKNSQTPPISLTQFHPTSTTISGLYQLLLFFQTIDDPQNMLKTAQEILKKNANDCIALSLLSQSQTTIAPIYQTRYLSVCQ